MVTYNINEYLFVCHYREWTIFQLKFLLSVIWQRRLLGAITFIQISQKAFISRHWMVKWTQTGPEGILLPWAPIIPETFWSMMDCKARIVLEGGWTKSWLTHRVHWRVQCLTLQFLHVMSHLSLLWWIIINLPFQSKYLPLQMSHQHGHFPQRKQRFFFAGSCITVLWCSFMTGRQGLSYTSLFLMGKQNFIEHVRDGIYTRASPMHASLVVQESHEKTCH